MGTHSTIAMHVEGTPQVISCGVNFDGAPNYNGRVLLTYYQDNNKIEQLIKGGDMASLGKEIGEALPYVPGDKFPATQIPTDPDNGVIEQCCYYLRDYQNTRNSRGYQIHTDFEWFLKNQTARFYYYRTKDHTDEWNWFIGSYSRPQIKDLTHEYCIEYARKYGVYHPYLIEDKK